jgi:hypothetical protein
MPLQKQTASLSFSGGIDSKTDPKQVVPGKLIALENAVFATRHQLRLRSGYRALGNGVVGTTVSIQSGQALASYQDELLAADGDSLYSLSPTVDGWLNKGSMRSVGVAGSPVIRNSYSQSKPDSTINGGIQVVAWEDSQGGVRYSVIDRLTGQNVVHDAAVDAAGSLPRVVSLGGSVLIFYVVGQQLRYRTIPVSTPTIISVAVSIAGQSLPEGAYDIVVLGTDTGQRAFIWMGVSGSGNKDMALLYLTSDMVGRGNQSAAVIMTAANLPLRMTVFGDSHLASNSTPNVCVAWWDTVDIRYAVYDFGLDINLHSASLAAAAYGVNNITGVAIPGAVSSFSIFWTISGTAASRFSVGAVDLANYSAGSSTVILRSVSLAGKAFVHGSTIFLPLLYDSSSETRLQNTYFLADRTGHICARVASGTAGPYRLGALGNVNSLTADRFTLAVGAREQLQSQNGNVFSALGVDQVSFDFAQEASYLRAELGGSLHLTGGFLQMYDGVSPVEHGFHLFPEGVTAAVSGPNSGTVNSYQYAITYEWTDGRGQIHRSAPSPIVTKTTLNPITGADADRVVTLTIPTLRLTSKQDPRAPVRLTVYRTVAGVAGAFYQVFSTSGAGSSIALPLLNDLTVDSLTFVDGTPDTTLVGNQLLYTTGGVVENIAAPACHAIAMHQNRLFLVSAENPLTLWYSKKVIQGAPVEFSDLFTIPVPPVGGPVTALASLDGTLVIFKANSIFAQTGDGPNDLGQQNSFTEVQKVQNDGGCINSKSIVQVPGGLLYQSGKGIYLLDRSLQVSYLGQDVEKYNSARVTSSALIPSTNQVRFTLETGVALVYDYIAGQWSTFTNTSAADSTIFQNVFTFIQPSGQVCQETPGEYSDAGVPINLGLMTSWLSFAGLQGFQRVYQLLLLGDYISAHRLTVGIAYDFSPFTSQEVSIDAGALLEPGTYGEELFGQGTPYGGTFPVEQFRIFLAQQKCQALQITIRSSMTAPGEGLALSALGFYLGVKQGPAKKPSGLSFG